MQQFDRIIFYDGFCVLCSGFVKYIIRIDKKKTFWYSSLQSDFAKDALKVQKQLKEIPDSIVYLKEGEVYFYSDAALKILNDLGGVFRLFSILYIIPKFIRNFFYKWLAKNRYGIFGKRKTCFIPDEKLSTRILN